jgi:hypothetical protein
MLNLFFTFFIFCLVLFIYIHINFHLKTSNDLEVYEIEETSKNKLEEICDLKQPVLFDFNNQKIRDGTNINYILNNYYSFDVKIRNTKKCNYESEIYIPLPLSSSVKLFNEDKEESYFTENNNDFLQETGAYKNFQYNDEFLRPYMVSNCNYDIMTGSENAITPFRYNLGYRNYFYVTSGSVKIKLASPKSSKYLHTIYDYDNFEFRSPINPWNPERKYITDFNKIKCLEITLNTDKILQIPPYWWYSIKFSKGACISVFKYTTYMNNISISNHYFLYLLQLQNVKRDNLKKLEIQSSSNNHIEQEQQEEQHQQDQQERGSDEGTKQIISGQQNTIN